MRAAPRAYVLVLATALMVLPALPLTADPPGKIENRAVMVDPDDLFIGPADGELEVEVTQGGKTVTTKKEVSVRLVTKTMVVYQEYRTENGKKVLDEAVEKEDGSPDSSSVKAVRVPGVKGEWKWDDKGKEYAGKVVPPEPIVVKGAKRLTDKQLSGYLVVSAERLHLGLDNALRAQDKEAREGWLKYAGLLQQYAQGQKQPGDVVALFEFEPYLKRQDELQEKLKQKQGEFAKEKLDQEQQQRAMRAALGARAAAATAKALFGGFASASDDADTQAAGLGLVASSADELLVTGLEGIAREANAQAAREALDKKAADALDAILKDIAREQDKRTADRVAVWKRLGVDPQKVGRLDEFAAKLVRSKDFSAAAEVMEARQQYLDKQDVFDLTAYTLGARLRARNALLPPLSEEKRRANADAVFGMAREAVAATARVPDDPAFARDRADLLLTAAELTHQAVCYSVDPTRKGGGPKRWSAAYDPRADFGVRVCDLALGEVGESGDRGAGLRTTRTWLLFQRGLFAAAFEQGQKVEKVRERDPYTQANLARVYAYQGKADTTAAAAERFVQALKVGFTDLAAVDKDADFQRVKAAKHKQLVWSDFDKPNLNVVMVTVPLVKQVGVQSYSFEVKNNGTMPLVNAVLTCGDDPKKPLARVTVDLLRPGGTYRWVGAFEANPRNVRSAELRVSNSGKKEVTVTNIQSGQFSPYSWWWGWGW